MAKNKDEKLSKENRHVLKQEIESLLSSIGAEPQESLVVDDKLSKELKQESPYDFEQMSSQFTRKAREITDSLFKNFVDIGIFEENDYAKHRKELDTINVSNLFFQLKTIKITIIKVMEQITSGNLNPRLIEVMGQLQDKMAALTKMQANYILFLEDTYRQLNNDKPVNPEGTKINSDSSEGQFFVTVGTKNAIRNLPEPIKNSDKKEPGSLVDPSNKSELLRKKNLDIKSDDSIDDDFIDLTEIL